MWPGASPLGCVLTFDIGIVLCLLITPAARTRAERSPCSPRCCMRPFFLSEHNDAKRQSDCQRLSISPAADALVTVGATAFFFCTLQTDSAHINQRLLHVLHKRTLFYHGWLRLLRLGGIFC